MKKIVVIDGQGGSIGKEIIKALLANNSSLSITAIGTNSIATSNMLKAGATNAATGENSVIVASRTANIILGPIGIVIADALLGEVTPKMAEAVSSSLATRVLIPVNRCDTQIAGVSNVPLSDLISDAILKVNELLKNN